MAKIYENKDPIHEDALRRWLGEGMKVTILTLFAISLSLLGAETKEIGYWLLEKRGEGGNQVAYFQGKPFTGKSFGFYHKSSQKRVEGNWKDGKKQGLWTHWHINGQKAEEQNFKDGIWHGPLKRWHDNGQIKMDENFKDGAIVGLATNWYRNGQQANEINYKVGLMLSVEVWKPNGEKCSNTTLKDGNGVLVIYNDDGTEKIRATFMDGVMVKD